MIGLTLLVAFGNLVLGYGLALWLAPARLKLAEAPATSADSPATKTSAALGPELAHPWFAALEKAGVVAQSIVEAAAQVIRLEVGRYRQELVELDAAARDALTTSAGERLEAIRARLCELNLAWLSSQRQAAEAIRTRRESTGQFADLGDQFAALLFDQSAQIESSNAALAQLALVREPEIDGKRLLAELGRKLDLAHRLRDVACDAIAVILAAEKRLETVAPALREDAATRCVSRLGLESLYRDWWGQNPERRLSFALVDVDRFARANAQHGARTGDRVLAEFARVLHETVRTERGFDRVCRVGGNAFLLFYGHTDAHEGNSALERIRQSMEATSFALPAGPLDLTLSGGVIEARAEDLLEDLLSRARQTLNEAKRKGRNCIAVDQGGGPVFLEPLQYPVKGQVVELAAVSAGPP